VGEIDLDSGTRSISKAPLAATSQCADSVAAKTLKGKLNLLFGTPGKDLGMMAGVE